MTCPRSRFARQSRAARLITLANWPIGPHRLRRRSPSTSWRSPCRCRRRVHGRGVDGRRYPVAARRRVLTAADRMLVSARPGARRAARVLVRGRRGRVRRRSPDVRGQVGHALRARRRASGWPAKSSGRRSGCRRCGRPRRTRSTPCCGRRGRFRRRAALLAVWLGGVYVLVGVGVPHGGELRLSVGRRRRAGRPAWPLLVLVATSVVRRQPDGREPDLRSDARGHRSPMTAASAMPPRRVRTFLLADARQVARHLRGDGARHVVATRRVDRRPPRASRSWPGCRSWG